MSLLRYDTTSLAQACRVSPILLCRSSQALSGRIGSATAQLFSGLSRDVRLGSSPGSGWATQGHSETCLEATPVFSVCLGSLSCWKVNLCPSLRSPTLLHCRDGFGQVMSSAWFPPGVMFGIQAKEFNLGFIRPENLVSHNLRVL